MAKIIGLPDGSEAEFPDDMEDDAIAAVLQKQFPAPVNPEAPAEPEPTGMANFGRQLGLSARAGANVIASPVVLGGRMLNKTINAMGGNVNPDLQGTVDRGLDAIGLPRPREDRPIEQTAQMMAQAAPAAALPGGVLPQVLGNATMSAVQAPAGEEGTQSVVGGITGGVGQGLSRAAGGIINPTVQALRLMKDKVKLTAGQMQGGWLKSAEEALAQTPFIGKPMRDSIAASNDSWQDAVRAGVVPPKAAAGASDNVSSIQEAFTQAYDDSLRLAGFRPNTNPTLPTSKMVIDAKQAVPNATAEQLQKAHTLVENLMENNGNPHTPASLQQVESKLKTIVGDYKYSSDPEQKVYGRVLDKITADMRSQWRSALTNTKQAELGHIDEQYSKFLPVQSASGKGSASLTGDELPGSFSPQALLKELRSGERGSRKAQWFAGKRPMQETATDAENVVGSKIKAPTTMARLMGLTGAIGTASGIGTPATVGALTAAGLYGTKPTQRILTSKFATGQHEYQKYLADAIRRFSPTVSAEINDEE